VPRSTISAFALVAFLSPMIHAQPGRDGNAGRYGWLSDLRSGKEQAKKTGKPMMVVLRCVP
jgi:hypothetical protein